MKKPLLLVATLFSVHASAMVEWVDRYTNCEVIFASVQPKIRDSGPQIKNHLSHTAAGKWGNAVIAFRGKNDGKDGVWILQGGGASKSTYFAPLPRVRKIKDDEDGTITNTWEIKSSVADRPPLFIEIFEPPGSASQVDISSRNYHDYKDSDKDFEHDADPVDDDAPTPDNVKFEPTVSQSVKDQYLEILINRVRTALPKDKNSPGIVATLKECQAQLKAGDKDDKRLVDAIEDVVKNNVTPAPPANSSGTKSVQ